MHINKKQINAIIAAVIALAAGAFIYTTFIHEKPAPKKNATSLRAKKAKRPQLKGKKRPLRASQAMSSQTEKPKPNLGSDADEEAKLTAAERALLAELQNGVDDEDIKRVVKAVEKIQAIQREKGIDAVPVFLRSEAVEALGWFLPDSLSSLLGFMADSDPDVLQDVMSQFEDAIDDSGLGDRELSKILKSVAKVLTDEDALDALFMGIENDMRNSVAVDTYLEILKTGSEAAKARIWESVSDFTGEDNITSEADLKKWAEDPENADDEDDEEFYGPDKDDDEV